MEPRNLTKADIDKVRHIEGFPTGTDEDIIALSHAPYYTACPNPFIEEFIRENGTPYDEETDDYHREPFAADVSEGKNDPVYNAHSYHTKVPYKAIMRYILHYTQPGDIVFDGFSGTGQTGVAAHMCGSSDMTMQMQMTADVPGCEWGDRSAILFDLAPIATFLSSNYNNNVDPYDFEAEAERILAECEEECRWMYETEPFAEQSKGQLSFGNETSESALINYVVWSDVFLCPHCGSEVVFWDVAVNPETGSIKEQFKCPHCAVELSKKTCLRAKEIKYDHALGATVSYSKQVPVLVNYSYQGKRYNKKPSAHDLSTISRIESMTGKYWFPTDELPDGVNTEQPRNSNGITHIHQFFTARNLYVLSCFYDRAMKSKYPNQMLMLFTGTVQICSKMSRFRYDSRNPQNTAGGILNGTLYIPSLSKESYVIDNIRRRLSAITSLFVQTKGMSNKTLVSTQSTTAKSLPNNSIDYIFTDPPFGANINYSELSFIWEPWIRVVTNNAKEAIINPVQRKALVDYQQLMSSCFQNYFDALKPNRWITIEFHNSKNSVWSAIQESILRAGFIIADVRVLNKKQGSFKQVTTTSAVKQDLVISAYKPTDSFRKNFISEAGTEQTAWAFVQQHLEKIPVVVITNDKIELIAERQAHLLFDRMVAYHIMQGIPVPLDATDFYRGLDEKLLKRDGMYFLAHQVNEYDTARIKTDVESVQFSMYVTNEKTAISWLYQQLSEGYGGAQTYAELQPKFMQEVKSVDKFEAMPELATLLEENFLQDEKGRWYIPDTTKEGDVAKLREKKLWKEFEGYMNSKGKLKLFRSEAIRIGFSRLWKDKNYQTIVDVAERLPEQTIQEDPNLLMYYDISLSRV